MTTANAANGDLQQAHKVFKGIQILVNLYIRHDRANYSELKQQLGLLALDEEISKFNAIIQRLNATDLFTEDDEQIITNTELAWQLYFVEENLSPRGRAASLVAFVQGLSDLGNLFTRLFAR